MLLGDQPALLQILDSSIAPTTEDNVVLAGKDGKDLNVSSEDEDEDQPPKGWVLV